MEGVLAIALTAAFLIVAAVIAHNSHTRGTKGKWKL